MELREILTVETQVFQASEEKVALGADRARATMIHLIKGEKVDGERRRNFGPGLLQLLHKKLLFYYPGWAGQLRISDDYRIAGHNIAKAKSLPTMVHAFEVWLENSLNVLKNNPEDIRDAIKVASAAHFAITGELHPFDDGNGRVARTLMNGILMYNSFETAYGIFIYPVPISRAPVDEKVIRKILLRGQEPKLMPYLQALEDVSNTRLLNPFELYIALLWSRNIFNYLSEFKDKYSQPGKDKDNWRKHLNKTELAIVNKLNERWLRLHEFAEDLRSGRAPDNPVPHFYTLR